MPTVLPLLRRLFLLMLAVSLALPPLVADALPQGASAEAASTEQVEANVPPCHGGGSVAPDTQAGSEDSVDCSQLCLWLCAHANAPPGLGLPLVTSDSPTGPVLRQDRLMRGPARTVPLRPPIA